MLWWKKPAADQVGVAPLLPLLPLGALLDLDILLDFDEPAATEGSSDGVLEGALAATHTPQVQSQVVAGTQGTGPN